MNNGGLQDTTLPEVPGYSVGRKLGRGGSADVWLVEAPKSGRRFALKCFHSRAHSRSAADGEPAAGVSEEDVRREIRILSVLDHQHLVKTHDVVRLGSGDDRRLGILLDFAAGGSLAQLVATRGRLTVGETVTVLTPLAQALAYLHAKGFTHADVSPGNVLFSAEGKPLLADVGIARMVGDPAPAAREGTPGFCDPSPVDGMRMGLQPERDLYSLAAVGWFCLTGEVPPATRDRPPLPLIHPEVPGALAAALESGLNEDRRQRPSAADFATAVYRSAAPAAVGLSTSVHPSVIPELLTRRRLPDSTPGSLRGKFQMWRRRLTRLRPTGSERRRRHADRLAEAISTTSLPAAAINPRSRRARLPRSVMAGVVAVLAAGLVAAAVFWAPGLMPNQGNELLDGGPTAAGPSPAAGGNGPGSTDGKEDGKGLPAGVEVQLGSPDPALAVLGLAWLRSEAFREGKPELLDQVNVAGSPAGTADARIMAGLQASGRVLAGFAMELHGIDVQPGGTESRVQVGVDSATTAYREVTAGGDQAVERAAAPSQRLIVQLERTDGPWRISGILPG